MLSSSFHNLAFINDLTTLLEHSLSEENLLLNHGIVLLVGVVCILQFTIWTKFKLEKLVAEFSLVTNIVPDVKLPQVVFHWNPKAKNFSATSNRL